jgi:hypothetical protein
MKPAGRRIGGRRRDSVPDSMPVLTRGKHRRPRDGACLMEYVSVLAGGPFTDSPACTDPTLAAVARAVNDYSGDDQRQRLAILASDLTTCGPLELADRQELARRCLLTAIPYSVGDRRRVLVVGALGIERAAAGATAGFTPEVVGIDTEFALLGSDTAVREAIERLEVLPVPLDQHRDRGLATSVELAAVTIAEEAFDSDDVLYDLLVACLDDHRRACGTGWTGARVAARDDGDGVAAGRDLRQRRAGR